MKKAFSGSCHCKNVVFKVRSELNSTFVCNYSFCIRRNTTLVKVDVEDFDLLCRKAEMGAYGNSGFSKHYFCKSCGIQCFTEINRENAQSIVVNVGCLEGVDVEALTPTLFDGANKL